MVQIVRRMVESQYPWWFLYVESEAQPTDFSLEPKEEKPPLDVAACCR